MSWVCGCALYDWIAEPETAAPTCTPPPLWSLDQRKATTTAAIIQIFYQFAKDLGGTSVVRVRFDFPAASEASTGVNATPSSSSTSSAPPASSPSSSSSSLSLSSTSPYPPSSSLLSSSSSTVSGAVNGGGGAVKRPTSTRTFPRYGQPPLLMHRPLYGNREGTTWNGGRRQTTISEGTSTGGDGEGRTASPTPLSSAFHASPFGSSAPPPPSSTTSAASSSFPTSASSSSSLFLSPSLVDPSSASVKFDMFAVENDALLLALFSRAPVSGGGEGEVASRLLSAFHRQFHPLLLQLHSTFLQMSKSPEDALLNDSFTPHFLPFTATIREMGLAPQTHSPSPPPPPPASSPERHSDGRLHLSSIEPGGLSSQSAGHGVHEQHRAGFSANALPPASEVT